MLACRIKKQLSLHVFNQECIKIESSLTIPAEDLVKNIPRGNHLTTGSKFGDLPSNQAGVELNIIKLLPRKVHHLHLYLQIKIIAFLWYEQYQKIS